jgi:hypothetical protein
MTKPMLLVMLTATLLVASVRTEAQDAASIADVRCVVVGMQIYDSGDSTQRATGMWLSLYYIGQLHGRAPQLDIENLLVEEASKMTASDSASEAKRCGAGLSAIAEQISRIGNDLLQRHGKPPVRKRAAEAPGMNSPC